MEPDEVVYDEAQQIFKPTTVTDEMMELACGKSILIRDMIKRFEKIDVDKSLFATNPKQYLENIKASNRLERKINRQVIRVCKELRGLEAPIKVEMSSRRQGKNTAFRNWVASKVSANPPLTISIDDLIKDEDIK